VVEASFLTHHVDQRVLGGGHVENRLPGVLRLELRLPEALEVSSVDQHDVCEGGDGSHGQQVGDAVLGLAGNPGVDLVARLVRLVLEVEFLDLVLEQIGDALLEFLLLPEVESVGRAQLVAGRVGLASPGALSK